MLISASVAALASSPVAGSSPQAEHVEIDAVLAPRRLGAWQITILVICGMASFVDGADRQSIGLVAVSLMRDFHISATGMGAAFSLDNLGGVIGSIVGGQLADRHGRKPVMIIMLAVIAAATLVTALTGSYPIFLASRFLAGVGLGGAVPPVLALASEYVSRPRRGMIAAMIFAGYPIGAAFGGFWTSYLLSNFDWRSVFYVGALLPTLVLAAAVLFLPESLQFLVRRPENQGRAARIAARISPDLRGRSFHLVNTTEARTGPAGSVRALFAGGLAASTLCLWGIYLFLFATAKVAVAWVPSILTKGGIDQASVALVFGGWNVGSTFAQLLSLRLIARGGSMRILVLGLIVLAVALSLVGIFPTSLPVVATLILVAGFGIGLAIASVVAIAATLYATEQRGIGMGAAMAASRFGQVLSPLLIAWLIDLALGTDAILYVIAAMPVVAAGLVLVFSAIRAKGPVPKGL